MVEKIIEKLKSRSIRTKALVAVGVIGMILILISEISFSPDSRKTEKVVSYDYISYVKNLDKELTEIISSIAGVGQCKVMITLKNTAESVYAKNSEKSFDESSSSENNEYVIYNGTNGDSPILLQENFPEIEGVAIVCSGGDNIAVKEQIIKCVTSLFNISSNRISVSKLTT